LMNNDPEIVRTIATKIKAEAEDVPFAIVDAKRIVQAIQIDEAAEFIIKIINEILVDQNVDQSTIDEICKRVKRDFNRFNVEPVKSCVKAKDPEDRILQTRYDIEHAAEVEYAEMASKGEISRSEKVPKSGLPIEDLVDEHKNNLELKLVNGPNDNFAHVHFVEPFKN